MDRGNIAPYSFIPGEAYISLLNTYETFGKKKSSIASNAMVTNDPNMYMLLPPEMRNNVQPVLPDINGEPVLPDRNR